MDLDKNDYTVRIKPMLDIKGRWTGQIDMSIVTQPGNDLSDDDYYSLMHFVKMICSSVPVMESNDDIRGIIQDYVISSEEKTKKTLTKKSTSNKVDDNIIYVNFSKGV
jgi:hypothetical protein|tara:strand:- start:65 stop:388 length:324 start_codon:yes stop_codon:yes gene_type:complete